MTDDLPSPIRIAQGLRAPVAGNNRVSSHRAARVAEAGSWGGAGAGRMLASDWLKLPSELGEAAQSWRNAGLSLLW